MRAVFGLCGWPATLVALVVCARAVVGCVPSPPDDPPVPDEPATDGGPPPRFDTGQVRLGSAAVANEDAPVVPEGVLPVSRDGLAVVDVGAVVVGADGSSGTILVDVDGGVHGVTVVVVGEPGATVVLGRAEAPDGAVVVDDTPPDPATPGLTQATSLARGFPAQFFSPGRVLPARHVGAFPLPSTADIRLGPGTWSFRVGHWDVAFDDAGRPTVAPLPRPVRVVVLVRTIPPAPGRVDLALHFTGAGGLTAAAAAQSAVLAEVIATSRTIFAAAGVVLGDVAYDDVADGVAYRTLLLDPPLCDGGDLDALLQGGRADRVNVYFVDRFECGAVGPFLLGLSPGIPGVPWTGASPGSGIVVAGTFLSTTPDRLAIATAHELGHHLGLFHSQENDRFGAVLYDNIADTGEAPSSRDNLMFFDVTRVGRAELSAGQGATIQRGPVVLP